MSGAQTSTFPTMNELLAPMAAYDTHQNQLLNQQTTQRALNQDEMEQVSRAANWIISADPENKDPAGQAQRYDAARRILLANGYAKNAPETYPGFEQTQYLARQGTPSQTQAEWGANIAANKAYSNATTPGSTPGATAPGVGGGGTTASSQLPIPGRGAGGPGAGAQLPPQYLDYFRQASAETGIPMDLLIAQARQESTFDPNAKGAAGEIGMFQIKPSTAQSPGFGLTGIDPASLTGNTPEAVRNNILFGARYLRARMGQGNPNDPAAQAAALAAYNGGGDPNYVANVSRYRPGFSPTDPAARVTTYAAAPPAAPPGGGTTPPPYRVAQAGPLTTPPPAATTAPQAASPAPVTTIEPETGLPVLSAPQNQMMPGQPNGPAATAPPAAPAAQLPPPPAQSAPAGGPAPPQLSPLNNRGLTTLQQAQIDSAASTGRLSIQDRIKTEQALANQNIATQQKAFGDWIQLQQLQTSQGQLSVSQANSALEYWKAGHPDAKVTLSGGEIITQDPRSGAEIAPRIQVTPSAAPRTVEGPGVWDGQKWVQAQPGQQGTPGKWTVGPGGGQFFPSQDAIIEEQKRDAARLADVRKDTLEQAQGASQTSALIGNAEQAMNAAISGKIPPGHFGPELLRITAAAKSLGIDLSPFGVDEKALAAGQVTREQLQQMNGAILRKMFPQRVTNMDLATTGAALPNYGLDPEALTANFRIYKAQADYDQARARDMLDYESQHGGSLVGWEHQWVQKHGFSNGPLDNLFSDAKSGNLGKGGAGAASNAPAYKEGDTATGKDGHKIIFHNGQWGPK